MKIIKTTLFVFLMVALLPCAQLHAEEVIRIRVADEYSSSSNEALRQRIWQLEKAVAQLQARVFQLESTQAPSRVIYVDQAPAKQWTCHLQSFGKTIVASGNTRASALAEVLQKCSTATHAIHCRADDAQCSNE